MRYSYDSCIDILNNSLKRIRYGYSLEDVLHYLGIILYLAVVFGPICALILETFSYLINNPMDIWSMTIPFGRRLDLLEHSLVLAIAVSISGTCIGVLVASALWSFQKGLLLYLRWFFILLLPIPPYIHALAWYPLFYGNYAAPTTLLPLVSNGWIMSWWVYLMAFLPIALGMSLLGLESVDLSMIEAGFILRQDIAVFANVVLPLARPAIMAGGGIIFLLCLTDYSVPSLFSVNVYPLEIFSEFSASGEPARSLLLSIPFLFPAFLVAVFSQAWLRNTAQTSTDEDRMNRKPFQYPRWFALLQWSAVAMLLLQAGVLLGSLLITTGTLEQFISSVYLAKEDLWFTLKVTIISSLVCLPLALAVAGELTRLRMRGQIWWLLVVASIAVPGPLIGIGLISIWNRPIFSGLQGTELMPIIAMLCRFTPLAALVLFAFLRRIDPILMDAARIFQANFGQTLLKIAIPMLIPGFFAAAAVVFTLGIGELGATLIVIPPGESTLTLRIYNYLHYGASSSVAGLCLLMVFATAVAGAIAIKALSNGSKIFFPNSGRSDELEADSDRSQKGFKKVW